MNRAVTFLLLLLSIVGCSIAAEADGRVVVTGGGFRGKQSDGRKGVTGVFKGNEVEEYESGITRNLKRKMKMKLKDDGEWEYVFVNKAGELVIEEDGCGYVEKNKRRRCAKTIAGEKVSDKCARTCRNHLPNYDDFVLEGDRVYVGCDAYVFRMNIQCDIFGENDPDLCLLKTTFIGLADVNGTTVVGNIPFNPYQSYGQDIDDLDPDTACIGSGVFSRKRIKNGEFAPVPMTSSDGCASVGKPDDYVFVMKGELSNDGSNDMKIQFSSDMGFTYYTEAFTQPGIYEAFYEDDVSASSESRRRKLTFNGDLINAPACQFADVSQLTLDTCTQHEIWYNNPYWVDETDPDSENYAFRRAYFDLVMGTDRWVANGFPGDFQQTPEGPKPEVKICNRDGTVKFTGTITNGFPVARMDNGYTPQAPDSNMGCCGNGLRRENKFFGGEYIIRQECECVPRCMQHKINPQPEAGWNSDPRFYNVYFDTDRERWEYDGFPGEYRRQPRYTPEVKICKADGSLRYEGRIINGSPWSRLEPFGGLDWYEEPGRRIEAGDYIVQPECACSSPSFSYTNSPSVSHTDSPSVSHTDSPSVSHTDSPSVSHTDSPSVSHTNSPSVSHTNSPSVSHTKYLYTFPTTSSSLLVHGLCIMSDSEHSSNLNHEITSTDSDLSYTEIGDFTDGLTFWGDRSYTVQDTSGTADQCGGGMFLQPSKHRVSPGTEIMIDLDLSEGPVTLCAFFEGSPLNRNGDWDLSTDGFTEASDTLSWCGGQGNGDGCYSMRSFCLVVSDPTA